MKKIIILLIFLASFINFSIAENSDSIKEITFNSDEYTKVKSAVDYYIINNLFNTPLSTYDKHPIIGNSKKLDINEFFSDEDSSSSIRVLDYNIFRVQKYKSTYALDIDINSIYVYKSAIMKYQKNADSLPFDEVNSDRIIVRLYIRKFENKFNIIYSDAMDFSNIEDDDNVNEFLLKIKFSKIPLNIKENYENPYEFYFNELKKLLKGEKVSNDLIFFKNNFETI